MIIILVPDPCKEKCRVPHILLLVTFGKNRKKTGVGGVNRVVGEVGENCTPYPLQCVLGLQQISVNLIVPQGHLNVLTGLSNIFPTTP